VTILAPMRPAVYDAYLQAAIADYAEDNVASGRWPREDALERSRSNFEDLLPQGLATPGNYLFEIKATENGPAVGFIWFAVQDRHGIRSAFVYDIEIKSEWRRQGHATRALEALEPRVTALGLSRIGLHVFGHNPGAQALYAKLGYGVTGINMVKSLGESRASPEALMRPPLRG
jgi:RimJ/RimL family protein N-acetyltransferase